jgi:hypothetical protein
MLIDKIDEKLFDALGMDVSGPVFYVDESTLSFSKDTSFAGKDLNDFPLPQWLPYDGFILHFTDGFVTYRVLRREGFIPRIATDSLSVDRGGKIGHLSPGNIVVYQVDEDAGNKLLTGNITVLNKETAEERLLTKNDFENGWGYVAAYYILFQFLSFLSCVNVGADLIEPGAKQQKARKKRGKMPLVSYYVLKLRKVTARYGTVHGAKGAWSNRVHFCRGHVREYTEERPLFGKYFGRFWVPPHARGNKENGVVRKDYAVCT